MHFKKIFFVLVFTSFCFAQVDRDTVIVTDSLITVQKFQYDPSKNELIKTITTIEVDKSKLKIKTNKKYKFKKGTCLPDTWEEESK